MKLALMRVVVQCAEVRRDRKPVRKGGTLQRDPPGGGKGALSQNDIHAPFCISPRALAHTHMQTCVCVYEVHLRHVGSQWHVVSCLSVRLRAQRPASLITGAGVARWRAARCHWPRAEPASGDLRDESHARSLQPPLLGAGRPAARHQLRVPRDGLGAPRGHTAAGHCRRATSAWRSSASLGGACCLRAPGSVHQRERRRGGPRPQDTVWRAAHPLGPGAWRHVQRSCVRAVSTAFRLAVWKLAGGSAEA